MTKKRILLIILASLTMLIYSFALLQIGMNIGKANQEQPLQAVTTNSYIVKEYNNMIAVFEEGSDVPQKVLDIDVTTLRNQDRLRFQEGIRVNSLDELIQLEEDFCS